MLVVVSAPHRAEAFEAARYAIDALKASVRSGSTRPGATAVRGARAPRRSRRRGRVVTALIIVIVVIAVVVVVVVVR